MLALLAAVHVLTACEGGEAIRREVEVLVRGDRQLKIFKHAARLAGLRGYRRSLRAVAEQAVSGRPLAQCHGSAASLRRAGEAAGHGRSMLTLPLHEAAEVSPISAVPWARSRCGAIWARTCCWRLRRTCTAGSCARE